MSSPWTFCNTNRWSHIFSFFFCHLSFTSFFCFQYNRFFVYTFFIEVFVCQVFSALCFWYSFSGWKICRKELSELISVRDGVGLWVKICPASEKLSPTGCLENWCEMVYCLSYLGEWEKVVMCGGRVYIYHFNCYDYSDCYCYHLLLFELFGWVRESGGDVRGTGLCFPKASKLGFNFLSTSSAGLGLLGGGYFRRT